jgi:hypothetical protein
MSQNHLQTVVGMKYSTYIDKKIYLIYTLVKFMKNEKFPINN